MTVVELSYIVRINKKGNKMKIKYIKPLDGTKPFGGFKCPRQLIAVSETGTYFLSLHPNYQAYEDAGEIGWAEYSDRPFTAFIYKLKNDVEIDLNKITFANWDKYVVDVFGDPTENVETIFEDNEGGRYWNYRKTFERFINQEIK